MIMKTEHSIREVLIKHAGGLQVASNPVAMSELVMILEPNRPYDNSLPASLRTAAGEHRYMLAKERGESEDIAKAKYSNFRGMKLMPNAFGYETVYKINDMLVAMPHDQFLAWWLRVGMVLEANELPYHQFIYNIGKRQSQPHVPHGQIVIFKNREDFCL